MKKSTIEVRLYDKDTHSIRKLYTKIRPKIKIPKKEVTNFKLLKTWKVTGNPSAEFCVGKRQYAFEFCKDKLVVTTYDWIKMNKAGDQIGIKNWKETVIQ